MNVDGSFILNKSVSSEQTNKSLSHIVYDYVSSVMIVLQNVFFFFLNITLLGTGKGRDKTKQIKNLYNWKLRIGFRFQYFKNILLHFLRSLLKQTIEKSILKIVREKSK